MSTSHTPGPWYFTTPEAEGVRGARRIKTSGLQVAGSDVEIIFAGVEAPLITEPDARLIAAAPELLEALKQAAMALDLADLVPGNEYWQGQGRAAARVAREAIGKAINS